MTDLAERTDDDEIVFTRVIPEDIVGNENADYAEEPATYVCEICADFFSSQRGLNGHIGRKHPDRKDLQKRTTNRSKESVDDSDYTPGILTFAKQSKNARPVQKFILNEVNSFLVTGISLAGVPDHLIDQRILEMAPGQYRSMRDVVCFTPREATVLAEATVRMRGTPVVERVAAVAGPLVPYFFGGLGVIIVIKHVIDAFTLRAKLNALSQMAQGQIGNDAPNPGKPQFI